MGLKKGAFGGPVSGLENQSKGPRVMRDEEEANNGLSGRKRRDIVSIVSVTSGLITVTKKDILFVALSSSSFYFVGPKPMCGPYSKGLHVLCGF